MKRGNTREKRGAVLGIVLFGLIQLACVAGFWALCLIPDLPQWLFLLFFAFGAFCAALMFPALWALKKRFRELDALENNNELYKEKEIMLLVNVDYIPGKELELLGMVKGAVVICLAVWVLGRTGAVTPEMAEGSMLFSPLADWIGAFEGGLRV